MALRYLAHEPRPGRGDHGRQVVFRTSARMRCDREMTVHPDTTVVHSTVATFLSAISFSARQAPHPEPGMSLGHEANAPLMGPSPPDAATKGTVLPMVPCRRT